MILKIDSSAIAAHVNVLMQISRSALPVAARQTLNGAAFDVKKTTMPKEAKQFTDRKKNFFQANSKVEQAEGFDMGKMRATIGFVPKSNDKSHSVEDLEQQENGGLIQGRSFIALPGARTSRSWKKMVKRNLTLGQINSKIVNVNNAGPKNGQTAKKRFVKSAVHAGKGGFVLGDEGKKSRLLYYINSVKRVDGNTKVNSTAIYSVVKNRSVAPDRKYNKFMRKASLKTQQGMEAMFMANAEKQIKKLMK